MSYSEVSESQVRYFEVDTGKFRFEVVTEMSPEMVLECNGLIEESPQFQQEQNTLQRQILDAEQRTCLLNDPNMRKICVYSYNNVLQSVFIIGDIESIQELKSTDGGDLNPSSSGWMAPKKYLPMLLHDVVENKSEEATNLVQYLQNSLYERDIDTQKLHSILQADPKIYYLFGQGWSRKGVNHNSVFNNVMDSLQKYGNKDTILLYEEAINRIPKQQDETPRKIVPNMIVAIQQYLAIKSNPTVQKVLRGVSKADYVKVGSDGKLAQNLEWTPFPIKKNEKNPRLANVGILTIAEKESKEAIVQQLWKAHEMAFKDLLGTIQDQEQSYEEFEQVLFHRDTAVIIISNDPGKDTEIAQLTQDDISLFWIVTQDLKTLFEDTRSEGGSHSVNIPAFERAVGGEPYVYTFSIGSLVPGLTSRTQLSVATDLLKKGVGIGGDMSVNTTAAQKLMKRFKSFRKSGIFSIQDQVWRITII